MNESWDTIDETKAFQIRITRPYAEAETLMRRYLAKARIAFAFQHEPDEEVNRLHTHFYMFDLDRDRKSIWDFLNRSGLKGNGDFSISQTAGKKKLPLSVKYAWGYGTKPELLRPEWVSGMTEEQRESCETFAKIFHNTIKDAEIPKELVRVEVNVEKKDNVWEKLKENLPKYKNKRLCQIKSMICAEWLNNGKAMPRGADLHRYALSLYVLAKYEDEEVPEWALESEFST